MIETINKLINYYKGYHPTVIPHPHPNYPLCFKFNERILGRQTRADCLKCPWILFEGKQCFGNYKKQNAGTRIDRLERWKEDYRRLNEGVTTNRPEQYTTQRLQRT